MLINTSIINDTHFFPPNMPLDLNREGLTLTIFITKRDELQFLIIIQLNETLNYFIFY
jgi:hypothetical protein